MNVPPSHRDEVRGNESMRYIDTAHVYIAELTCPIKDFEDFQIRNYELREGVNHTPKIHMPDIDTGISSTAHYPVSYLRRIFDNVTSDDIVITVQDDAPIVLEWRTDDDAWTVMVAPRIEPR